MLVKIKQFLVVVYVVKIKHFFVVINTVVQIYKTVFCGY